MFACRLGFVNKGLVYKFMSFKSMYEFQHSLCIEYTRIDGKPLLERIIYVDKMYLIAATTRIRRWMIDFKSSGNL
jgi:hypothetical protein